MIALMAALGSLVCLLQLPLCVVAVAEFSDHARIGVGVSPFSLRNARNRALRRMHPRKTPFHLPPMEKTGWFDEMLHGAKYLYAHRLLLRVTVNGEIGGTDAARIAVYWGAAQSLLTALYAATDGRITGHISPNFSSARCRGEIRITYAVKAGSAVWATLQAVGEHLSEKVRPWINTPLKA